MYIFTKPVKMFFSANFKFFSINDCFLLEYQCQQIYLNLLPITVLLASSATRFAKMLTLGIEAKNNAFGQFSLDKTEKNKTHKNENYNNTSNS